MIDFYGDQSRWFIGVVKNNDDPLAMGRLQVRIHGIHGEDQDQVPDEKLPWAQVLTPVTEGGVTNLGNFLGIQTEARVFGIFLDGVNSQQPLILGSIPHSIEGTSTGGKKTKVITNVMAQGTTSKVDEYSEFDVAKKTEKEMIDEPLQKNIWKPVYPNNKVTQTPSGHVIEIDDTPDAERIHIYHKSGTFIEMQPNGDVVTQHKNGFRSVTGDDKLFVDGNLDIFTTGSCNFMIEKDMNISTRGNVNVLSKGNHTFESVKGIKAYTNGTMDLRGKPIHLNQADPVLQQFQWNSQDEPEAVTVGGSSTLPVDENGNPINSQSPEGLNGPFAGSNNSGHPEQSSIQERLKKPNGKCTRDDLGFISHKQESNGNPGVIGDIEGDLGGLSYGLGQITSSRSGSNPSNMDMFINDYLPNSGNAEFAAIGKELQNAGGGDAAIRGAAGNQEFKTKWKSLAGNPDFAKAQSQYLKKSHYDTGVDNMVKAGLPDFCDGTWSVGVQEAIYSTTVQHGVGREKNGSWNGAPYVLDKALKRTGKWDGTTYKGTQAELISAIYDERGKENGSAYFGSSSLEVQNNISNIRFPNEKKIALGYDQLPDADEGVNILTGPGGAI